MPIIISYLLLGLLLFYGRPKHNLKSSKVSFWTAGQKVKF